MKMYNYNPAKLGYQKKKKKHLKVTKVINYQP